MFENAARKKFRFASSKGDLTTEDLWDLPLTSTTGKANLDDIARGLFKQLRSGDDVSFVDTDRSSDPTIQAKFDLVKHVIDTKKIEAADAVAVRDRAAKKQVLLGILKQKEDNTLMDMTADELKAAIAAL